MIKKLNKNPSQKNIDISIKELCDDKNNAVFHVYKSVKVSNKGILAGVPITIKNNFATKEGVTDASTKLLKNFKAGYDSHIITLLKNNGASIVAKVNLDELSLGGTGLYSSHGIIKHPIDNTRIIGGSSSGSAATFTKNIGAAICTDTGDSIRVPASYVGAVGFKPSYGLISRRGLFAYSSSLDTVGYLTHSVEDSAIMSSVLFKQDFRDSTSKKINFKLENVVITKPEKIAYLSINNSYSKCIKDSFNNLIKKLKNKDIVIDQITIDSNLMDVLPIIYKIISFSEVASNNSNLSGLLFGNQIEGEDWSSTMIKTRYEGFGKIPTTRMLLGSIFLKKENQKIYLEKAQKIRRLIVQKFSDIFNKYDLLLFPTCQNIAPKIEKKLFDHESVVSINDYQSKVLLIANFLGSPSITIPLGKQEKMPYGLNINSKIYTDEKLLSHSLYLEKLIGDENE